MAALFFAALLALPASSSWAASPQHHLSLETVAPGREGLELTARLTGSGGTIERNVSWTIRTPEGVTIFSGETGLADVSAPPGDYVVEVSYGAAKLSRSISIPREQRVTVSFVLDAGGLRVQPRIDGDGVTARSRVRVFALDGARRGSLIATAAVPGDILRLPAGRYRVESRVTAGNAGAVTDIDVKGGRVSWIDISMKAGVARLSFVGSPGAEVIWTVDDDEGNPVAFRSGLTADMVLRPGTYRAKAKVGPEELTATFKIASGQTRDIMLGN